MNYVSPQLEAAAACNRSEADALYLRGLKIAADKTRADFFSFKKPDETAPIDDRIAADVEYQRLLIENVKANGIYEAAIKKLLVSA